MNEKSLSKLTIEARIARIRSELNEMRQYKAILAEDGMTPDKADKERESALIVQLLRLERDLNPGKRPLRPAAGRPQTRDQGQRFSKGRSEYSAGGRVEPQKGAGTKGSQAASVLARKTQNFSKRSETSNLKTRDVATGQSSKPWSNSGSGNHHRAWSDRPSFQPASSHEKNPGAVRKKSQETREHSRFDHKGPRETREHSRFDHKGPRETREHSRFDHKGPRETREHSRFDHKGPRETREHSRFDRKGPRETREHSRFDRKGPRETREHSRFDRKGPRETREHSRFDHKGPRETREHSRFDHKGPRETREHSRFDRKGPRETREHLRFDRKQPRDYRKPLRDHHKSLPQDRRNQSGFADQRDPANRTRRTMRKKDRAMFIQQRKGRDEEDRRLDGPWNSKTKS